MRAIYRDTARARSRRSRRALAPRARVSRVDRARVVASPSRARAASKRAP
jgi:hypothetical protein